MAPRFSTLAEAEAYARDQRKLVQNPAWVTSALANAYEILERKVPPQWLPQLASVNARRGRMVASIDEYGCGAYGCVVPTLDESTVLKATTDLTEAEFAARISSTLVVPVVVEYRMVVRLSETHRKVPIHLLWREAADRVGKIDEDAGPRAEERIGAQHRAAQAAYHDLATNHGAGVWPLIEEWKRHCAAMAEVPELAFLSNGMLRVFEEQKVFFGDVHGGNIGLVHRQPGSKWLIVDPGHVAVINGPSKNPSDDVTYFVIQIDDEGTRRFGDGYSTPRAAAEAVADVVPYIDPEAFAETWNASNPDGGERFEIGSEEKRRLRLVRTKSGNKVHLAGAGSVQTYCGIRHAGTIRLRPGQQVGFCKQCGLGEMDVETAITKFGS